MDQIPGVRFILCVVVTDRLANAEYKLYTVERNAQTNEADPLPDLAPVRVEAPHTMVKFDSRELLGLPPGSVIPDTGEQFPDPAIEVDLYEVLVVAHDIF
ncbi:hypothetical protein JG688_00015462 [Phytophthora aleatoria]|uniref:Uncharacterized protein n=1 Tax=Phytophthora aleatoria TaxID=2496075 RepID=A0A8J5IZF7_9STRA|nr:hypothetical protein JG688_00015462 [Phytophthora aleatoria]